MPLQTRAYAKINLGLSVVRRRPDGYHDIETVFHRIDLYDRLTFEEGDEILLRTGSAEIPGDERNLCYRAAALLREYLGHRKGVVITLDKRIPVGAGLGGGSSDAATTLRSLVSLWNVSVPDDDLATMALKLGSDVPYFLNFGSALAKGRGEILEYFQLMLPYAILVANPGIHVSTPWAYSQISPPREQHHESLKCTLLDNLDTPSELARRLRNDFEDVVFREFPAVGRLKQEMISAGASFALMSGSGSTVYGLFREERKARLLGKHLADSGLLVSITAPMFTPSNQPGDES